MKVILNDHVDHLGERGDVVEVKPGYARNYLLPQGFAYLDTPGNRRRFALEQSSWDEMDLERRGAAERLAARMAGTELTFERRAGDRDVLFGSVSLVDVGRELAARGFDLDRRRVLLDHPIKALGTYQVEVQIHRDIKVPVAVHVVRPGGPAEPAPAAAEAPDSLDEASGSGEGSPVP